MPIRFQPSFQFKMVVNLAVVHEPDGLVFVCDRLFAGVHVYNAQAPHRQTNISRRVGTLLVRASVDDPLIHGL
jgi:hypothetical protein